MFFVIALIVIPLAAGYVANLVVGKGKGFEPWELFVAGIAGWIVGAAIGDIISGEGLLNSDWFLFSPLPLITATIGAIIVLAVWGWLRLNVLSSKS
ncbi:MAG: hypothetical protein R6W93_08940 [Candidatus Limnocylindrales bacterium]|jgi:uncharacterized membrane protein YeaQ/YmgE (transglycosylase-associated protein family)